MACAYLIENTEHIKTPPPIGTRCYPVYNVIDILAPSAPVLSLKFWSHMSPPNISLAYRPSFPPLYPPTLFCAICGHPVRIETAKTDEHGRAIHDGCYLLALKSNRGV